MKSLIKKLLPYSISRRVRAWLEYRRDLKLYMAFSGPEDEFVTRALTGVNREMQLMKDAHRVEKGLALREPRRPFGLATHARLGMLLDDVDAPEAGTPGEKSAKASITALVTWNETGEVDPDIAPTATDSDRGIGDADAFFTTRHSVRDFTAKTVDREVLEHAVELAVRTPSVCNRQSWRVYMWDKREDIDRMLRFQNGNAGFGQQVPALALVTVERGMFAGPNERNQVWIEGGLFSMSLTWALHALGLDTCLLNMSLSHRRLEGLIREAGVPESEAIVMFAAIGYGAKDHRVAKSPRLDVSQVLRWRSLEES